MVARVVELSDESQRQLAEIARQTGRAEDDVLRDAVTVYLESHGVPRPTSDGVIDDPDLAARDIDEWLVANWRPASPGDESPG